MIAREGDSLLPGPHGKTLVNTSVSLACKPAEWNDVCDQSRPESANRRRVARQMLPSPDCSHVMRGMCTGCSVDGERLKECA